MFFFDDEVAKIIRQWFERKMKPYRVISQLKSDILALTDELYEQYNWDTFTRYRRQFMDRGLNAYEVAAYDEAQRVRKVKDYLKFCSRKLFPKPSIQIQSSENPFEIQ